MCRATVAAVTTEDDAFPGAITSDSKSQSLWRTTLSLGATEINFKIDTGADVTVISDAMYQSCTLGLLKQSGRILHGPCQSALDVKGYSTGELEQDDTKVKQDIYVVHDLQTPLLGRPAIEALQLLARINAVTAKESYKTAYPNLFEGLGTLPGEYRIELQPDT